MARMKNISQGGKRFVGIVTVVTGDRKARLKLNPNGKDIKFPNGTLQMDVALDELPSRPRIKAGDKSGKEYRVRLTADGSEVEAFTPVRGRFKAKATKLGPRDGKDADPIPEEKQFKPEDEPYLEFWCGYEFTEGPFQGVESPAMRLHYKFMEGPDGDTAIKGDFANKKATRLQQLKEWGIAHGIWSWKHDEEGGYLDCDPIPWDDVTILPELESRLLDADREVYLTFDNGYPVRIDPLEDNPYDDEESDDEPVEESIDDEETEDEFDEKFPEPVAVKAQPKTKVVKPVVKAAPAKANGKVKSVKKSKVDEDDDL